MGLVRTEDGVELVGRVGELREGLGGLPEVLVVVEEVDRTLVLEHLDTGGVEGSNAALGRRESQLGACLHEDIVGVCKLRLKGRLGQFIAGFWQGCLAISVEAGLQGTKYYLR